MIFGFTGARTWLVSRVDRAFHGHFTAVFTAIILVLIGSLAALGFDYWAYRIRVDADLVVASASSWFVDRCIALGVTLLVTVIGVVVALACVRFASSRWWIPAAAIAGVGVIVAAWAYPVIVEPLFTNTTPISRTSFADEEAGLLRLAREDGFSVSQIEVSDASQKTTTLNAYVSGFNGRIVIFDNLLKDSTSERVRMVVAHELGHAKEHDVLIGAGIAALAVIGFVAFLGAIFRDIDAWNIPRILAIVAIAAVLVMPATNFISRSIEWRADEHALELTNDRETFIAMQRELAVANASALDPPSWRYWWFFTHPTSPQRIAFGQAWTSKR